MGRPTFAHFEYTGTQMSNEILRFTGRSSPYFHMV